jgi:histidinol phosphatase-like enzyme
MNRFKYLLDNIPTRSSSGVLGIFPWGLIIDDKETSIKNQRLTFTDEGVEFLQIIASKQTPMVLFLNQFKPPVPMNTLKEFAEAVEDFVKKQGVNLVGMYWCPGSDKKDPFVVPNAGMFHRVTENTGISWDGMPVISNNELDLTAALKVKALPIKIGGNSTKWTTFASLGDWNTARTS